MAILLLLIRIFKALLIALDTSLQVLNEQHYQDLLTHTLGMEHPTLTYVGLQTPAGLHIKLITAQPSKVMAMLMENDGLVTGPCIVTRDADMVTIVVNGQDNIHMSRSEYLNLVD